MEFSLRVAKDEDCLEVTDLVKEAFNSPNRDQKDNEWDLINKIRRDKGFVEELSLIAHNDEEILGHILFSKANIGDSIGLALGPIAVKPEYQGIGIGKSLINYGIEKSKEMGYKWIAVLGGDYYYQFGYEDAMDYGIMISDSHPGNEYLKIILLRKEAYPKGKIIYCDSFYNENGELL